MSDPTANPTTEPTGPLKGVKVFDLTRVLAGPTCVQMLADLGADVVKIEKPGSGDDTRGFAPPFMPGTKESAYFVGANRNKRSVTLDIAKPEGQAIALRLIAQSDILAENFKVGALAKYGLGYPQLHAEFPGLIYCSITGFGQTGPYAARPGYDLLVQAMGGLMSITGRAAGETGAGPQKAGVAVTDILTGLYDTLPFQSPRDARSPHWNLLQFRYASIALIKKLEFYWMPKPHDQAVHYVARSLSARFRADRRLSRRAAAAASGSATRAGYAEDSGGDQYHPRTWVQRRGQGHTGLDADGGLCAERRDIHRAGGSSKQG